MYVYIYLYFPNYNPLSLYNVPCIYVFRTICYWITDWFTLPWRKLFLPLRITYLPIVLHVLSRPCRLYPVHFRMSLGDFIVQLTLRKSLRALKSVLQLNSYNRLVFFSSDIIWNVNTALRTVSELYWDCMNGGQFEWTLEWGLCLRGMQTSL